MYNRKKTNVVLVKDVKIGGDNPISIQSMCNTKTRDVKATVNQINELAEAGCEIVRVAVPTEDDARAIKEIVKEITIPLVCDIHFDYKLALMAVENGCHKLRINPGNIGSKERVMDVTKACRERNIPIRIGVNGGSLNRGIVEKFGHGAEALCESAIEHVRILEEFNFFDIVISAKSSDVYTTYKAHEMLSERVSYPLHIGITEAGLYERGVIKSAAGIGAILARGIGDTMRVTLTDNPVKEIEAARQILEAMGLRRFGPEIISCPTCGRTSIGIIDIAKEVEQRLKGTSKQVKIAIMGCVVNGPGEAKDADLCITGANGDGLIFKKGNFLRKVKEADIVSELMIEIEKLSN